MAWAHATGWQRTPPATVNEVEKLPEELGPADVGGAATEREHVCSWIHKNSDGLSVTG